MKKTLLLIFITSFTLGTVAEAKVRSGSFSRPSGVSRAVRPVMKTTPSVQPAMKYPTARPKLSPPATPPQPPSFNSWLPFWMFMMFWPGSNDNSSKNESVK